MKLTGQARRDDGYAMAALLVGLSITAIMMTVVMPVWKQMARREKEDELIFRGQQYVPRASTLSARSTRTPVPPNLDVLVEQRFLRKKFKDPITNDDFQPVLAGQAVPGTYNAASWIRGANATQARTRRARGARTRRAAPPLSTAGRGFSPIGTPGAGATGGVIGVVSKSKDTSIRLYNGRNHYNEWAFVNTPQVQAPGGARRGTRWTRRTRWSWRQQPHRPRQSCYRTPDHLAAAAEPAGRAGEHRIRVVVPAVREPPATRRRLRSGPRGRFNRRPRPR